MLENVVEEMAIAGGLPKPAIYVVPDSDPNAFATGTGPERASIAVTRGLLEKLNREELQGVVSHELSHVRNYDVRLMTVVAALAGAILLLSDWSRRGLWWGGGRRRDRDGGGGLGILFFAVWIVSIMLAPIIAQIVSLAVSRQREYLADASGAELTRNPLGLASALEKIAAAVDADALDQAGHRAPLHRGSPRPRAPTAREGFSREPLLDPPADREAHRAAARDGLPEVSAEGGGCGLGRTVDDANRLGKRAGPGGRGRLGQRPIERRPPELSDQHERPRPRIRLHDRFGDPDELEHRAEASR